MTRWPRGFALGAILIFCCGFALALVAQELLLHRTENEIRIAAPRTHFLTGAALQRIKDGNTVHFDFQVTLASGERQNVVQRIAERFTVSYDLWEERFSITKVRARKSAAHLSASEAELWCWSNLSVPAPASIRDKPLFVRLDIRAEDPMNKSPLFSDPGMNLAALIEIFSRPAGRNQASWTLETGPVTWGEIKQGT